MMGCGCSSPLCNTRRDAKLKSLGIDPAIEAEKLYDSMGIKLDFSEDFPKLWEKIQE